MTLLSSEVQPNQEQTNSNVELADFLYRSFYFSQGSQVMHDSLMCYGQEYYSGALDMLTEDDKAEMTSIAEQRASSWTARGPHLRLGTAEVTAEQVVRQQIGKWANIFASPDGSDWMENIGWMNARTTRVMIDKDYNWLVEKGGRPERAKGSTGEFSDQYLSHAIFYGLLRNNAHNPAMNSIFDRLQPTVATYLSGLPVEHASDWQREEAHDQLHRLLQIHLKYHPDDEGKIEEALSHAPTPETTA